MNFNTWRTIALESFNSPDELLRSMHEAGYKVGEHVAEVLAEPSFNLHPAAANISLAIVSLADLGFLEKTAFEEISVRAQENGLSLCPAEVGPQLRLQYADQLSGEKLIVGMEPIIDAEGRRNIFAVSHDEEGLSLIRGRGTHLYFEPSDRFVFSLAK